MIDLKSVDVLEELVLQAGMASRLRSGAASCVFSLGCNGVEQAHLESFAVAVARGALDEQARSRRVVGWVLEWGAVSLPYGHDARITEMTLHRTRQAAEEAAGECDFNCRVFPVYAY